VLSCASKVVAIDNGERALRNRSATLLILPLLLLTEQRQKMIAPKSFLILPRGGSPKKKRREALSNPPLVSPWNNPRRAPWTSYGVCAGNSDLIDENAQSGGWMIAQS
jgi:hypothetical protein